MKAVAVRPGIAKSLHAREIEPRRIDDVPNGRGVLVRTLQVGICGTDREIYQGEFGAAPHGEDFLVIGHETLGEVIEVGPGVPSWLRPGMLVNPTVRRPGQSLQDRIGAQDFSADTEHVERGIGWMHGFMTERWVEDATWLVPVPTLLREVGLLCEPMSVGEKGVQQAFAVGGRVPLWRPERAAVLGAGPIGMLAALNLKMRGLDVVVYSRRAAPYRNSDMLQEIGVHYASAADSSFAEVAKAHGPFDIVFEASGNSEMVMTGVAGLANNGVLVVSSITGGHKTLTFDADWFNLHLVVGNRAIVGMVNASRDHVAQGLEKLVRTEALHPGWLARLMTRRIEGLDRIDEIQASLESGAGEIKAYVAV